MDEQQSILDIHDELQANLSSALDYTKLMSVFTTMISVVKNQQLNINELEAKLAAMTASQSGGGLDNAKLQEIEEKLDQVVDHIFGDQTNNTVPTIELDKVSPFQLFERSSSMFKRPAPEEIDDLSVVHEESSLAADDKSSVVSQPSPIPSPPPKSPVNTDDNGPQEEEKTTTEAAEESKIEEVVVAPPSVAADEEEEEKQGEKDVMVVVSSVPPSVVPSRPRTPVTFRDAPIDDDDDIDTKVAPIKSADDSFFIGPVLPNKMVYIPPAARSLIRGKSPLVRSKRLARRKMNVENIDDTFPENRRAKILKELQRRGKFFLLARDMLADARQRYSNQSLKKQLDVAEVDIATCNEKLTKLHNTIKKNYIHLRELLPAHFDDTYEQVKLQSRVFIYYSSATNLFIFI